MTNYQVFQGTSTEYKALHHRIGRDFGKPSLCDDCGITKAKRFEWANISGEYHEVREDWKRLCAPCHKKFDAHYFMGKRFAGKRHKSKSKSKTAESMRRFWQENREFMLSIHHNSNKTHCKNGHEFTPENTYLHPHNMSRHCRICKKVYKTMYKERIAI